MNSWASTNSTKSGGAALAVAAAWLLGTSNSNQATSSGPHPNLTSSSSNMSLVHASSALSSGNETYPRESAIDTSAAASAIPSNFSGGSRYTNTSESSSITTKQSFKKNQLVLVKNGLVTSPTYPLNVNMSSWSFKRDFTEIAKLGHGAYGAVFQAKSILDDKKYAIKKIILPKLAHLQSQRWLELASDTEQPGSSPMTSPPLSFAEETWRYLREAHVMASVTAHRNIVRFYHSWLEVLPVEQDRATTLARADGSGLAAPSCLKGNSNPFSIPFSNQFCKTDDSWNEITGTVGSEGSESNPPGSLELQHSDSESYDLVLFIQMELCKGATLHDWLRLPEREVDGVQNRKLFQQLIEGLDYLHSKCYCHRDIKPANLLMVPKGETMRLKVGDFGCCKKINKRSALEHHDHPVLDDLTSGCGTASYMAPEQESYDYDEKVDIFAAGIVLFELYHVFDTEMERHILLKQLREKRLVDVNFAKRYPAEAALVLKMTHPDPKMRPSTYEILNNPNLGICRIEDLDDVGLGE